jgi:hypothetical protein
MSIFKVEVVKINSLHTHPNADSIISPNCMMEGVVVQPIVERTYPEIGRVVLKLISDRYLLCQDGTELH